MILSLTAIIIPLFLAALGGLVSEQAGKLNIALEGLILAGAFTAYSCLEKGLSPAIALIAAALAAAGGGAFLGLVNIKGKANLFVAGLALNLLIPSLITTLSLNAYETRGVLRLTHFSGGLREITGLPLFIPLTLILAILLWGALHRTAWGLALRTAGSSPELLRLRRRSAQGLQLQALTLSGLFCGLAGAFLTFRLGAFVPGISAGRGWIALVLVYLGFRHPLGLLGAALLYASAEEISILAQGLLSLPSSVLQAFPYIIMVLFLIIPSVFSRRPE